MMSSEVLGVQAARRALDEVRDGLDDPLIRDRLDRVEAVLARVAANLALPAVTDPSLGTRPEGDGPAAIGWDDAAIRGREAAVAALDPRQRQQRAGGENLAERLERYLRVRFPSEEELRVTAARHLPGGRSKHTLIVDTTGSGALPPRIVLRTDSSRTTSHDSVAREFPLIEAVHRAGCPVAAPLWLERDEGAIGAAFIAFSHMPGAPAGNLWGAFDKGGDAARELAAALAKVHRVPVTEVYGGVAGPARAAVAALFALYRERWLAAPSRPSAVIASAFAWLEARLGRLGGDAVVVHGDAHFSNMLMDGGRLTCLLDWEFWHFGHPAEDLAYARPYVEQTLDWAAFLRLYAGAGGRPVAASELELFAVWRPLRNAVLASVVAHDFRVKEDLDLDTAAIALSTFPRMEAQVAAALVRAMH